MDTIEISPYFYSAFQLVNSDLLSIEQSNKIGGSYISAKSDGVTIKGFSFNFTPAIDLMFKINSKIQFGTGLEMTYVRFSGEIETNANTFDGVADGFQYEFNFLQAKFIF